MTNTDPAMLNDIAAALAELGHPTRLAIFRRLVQAGERGLPVGLLGEAFEIAPSTLSHHLKGLIACGLIEQIREGRTLWCRPRFARMHAVIGFLTEQCCQRPAVDGPACVPCIE